MFAVGLDDRAPQAGRFAVWPAAPHMPLRLRLAVDALVEQLPVLAG